MSMADLERALEVLGQLPNSTFSGPKSDELICHAERTLGLTFGPTYRLFLSRLGNGGVAGCEFYGLINDDFEHSSVPDAIWLTLQKRQTSGLSHSFILIAATGYGGYYALDTSQPTASGDIAVVEWQPFDSPDTRRFVAEDFGAFFWETIQWASQQ